MTLQENILNELNITQEVLAIFPYGSIVYGTLTEHSDRDYIIVTKSAFLNSGSFKDNAISNSDKSIQAVLYSRGGFIDAINNYNMPAMECISLDKELVILNKWKFAVQKWNEKDLIQKVIQQSSASWHIAEIQSKDGFKDRAKKGIFHALRILDFGRQLKENKKIVDFQSCNNLNDYIKNVEVDTFDTRDYNNMRQQYTERLKA